MCVSTLGTVWKSLMWGGWQNVMFLYLVKNHCLKNNIHVTHNKTVKSGEAKPALRVAPLLQHLYSTSVLTPRLPKSQSSLIGQLTQAWAACVRFFLAAATPAFSATRWRVWLSPDTVVVTSQHHRSPDSWAPEHSPCRFLHRLSCLIISQYLCCI